MAENGPWAFLPVSKLDKPSLGAHYAIITHPNIAGRVAGGGAFDGPTPASYLGGVAHGVVKIWHVQ